MPKNDIGGFFVSLGLNVDKNSFETGNKFVDAVGNSLSKLIGTARNASVVLAGMAVASGTVESAAYKTAEKIGISTEALDLWKASAKIAGVNANGLLSAMGSLSNVMGRMRIDGAGLDQFTKKLCELGLVVDKVDIAKMLNMAPDELMTDILRKAQDAAAKTKDTKEKQRISIIVGDVLGEAGQDFFIELQRQGKTIDEFLTGAGRTVFTTAADNQKGANFAVEVNTLRTEIESASKLLGDAIGGELTKYVKELNQWIQENGPTIRSGINDIARIIGKIAQQMKVTFTSDEVKTLASAFGDAWKGAVNTVKNTGSALAKGDLKGAGTAYVEGFKETVVNPAKTVAEVVHAKTNNMSLEDDRAKRERQKKEHDRIRKLIDEDPAKAHGFMGLGKKYKSELQPETIQAMAAYEKEFGRGWNFSGSVNEMKDGIMRPDGTVTQVAPDDWVFAARNVGDLARAFIPQSFGQATASAPSEYIINQTFNISGGNDMPQVLREQAYRGTQDGLMQLMQQSSQRLQLMSGTR